MIPVCRPDITQDDVDSVAGAVAKTFVGMAPPVVEFEEAMAAHFGRRFAVTVNSGTTALAVAVRALDLPPGSRILVPTLTIVAALHAIQSNGHVPVFVDVDPDTWNVTEAGVAAVLDREPVDAAIVVQTYSVAPPMAAVVDLLHRRGVRVIEDSAEGMGGSEKDGSEGGRRFGTFGEITILSFFANKLITTGEGGMALTDDEELAERMRLYRNLGFDRDRRFIHAVDTGAYRMSALQAALGLSQLKRWDAFHAHRRRLYHLYLDLLGGLDNVVRFQRIDPGIVSPYWVFPVLLRERGGLTAIEAIAEMRRRGIESRHFFYPLDRQPCLKTPVDRPGDIGFGLWQRGLYLPLGNAITEEEVRASAAAFREMLLVGADR